MHSDIKFSPLFWPIQLEGETISILDETLLPHKTVFIKARTYQQAAQAIKEMKTRAVGQVILVLYTFLMVVHQNKDTKNKNSIRCSLFNFFDFKFSFCSSSHHTNTKSIGC